MTSDLVGRIRGYLFDRFLPFTREHFLDEELGGFHERLGPDGVALEVGYKRLLVQCRQIYLFSHAALAGAPGNPLAAAQHGYGFLREHFADHEHGGWFFSTTPAGDVHDPRKDLYGHAFLIFGLAYYARAAADRSALAEAESTMALLERHLADRARGGYLEGAERDWTPRPAVRRQNPHMHLLEALLALDECAPAGGYLAFATELVTLLRDRLFDEPSGTLGEYFTDDWRADPGRGHVVEPGHHFEWAWLLDGYGRAARDPSVFPLADRLLSWGLRHGHDSRRGGFFDEVDRGGRALGESKRIWPLLEGIKACAVRAGREEREGHSLAALLAFLFDRYLREDGGWQERLDGESRPLAEELPGSTGYHIWLGLSEALRVFAGEGSTAG